MLAQTVEPLTKTVTALSEKTLAAMRPVLANYAVAKRMLDQAEAAMKVCKEDVSRVFEQTGESSVNVDGASVTLVAPVQSKLDQKKLIMQGVTFAQIEAATVVSPGTPYLRITLPKERK